MLCFHITSLALLLKQQQRKRNIGLCGCQYRACQNLVLAGLKPPDGGGTVCVCVFFFFLVSSAFGKVVKWEKLGKVSLAADNFAVSSTAPTHGHKDVFPKCVADLPWL